MVFANTTQKHFTITKSPRDRTTIYWKARSMRPLSLLHWSTWPLACVFFLFFFLNKTKRKPDSSNLMACCQSSTVWCQCSGTWNAVTDTVMSIIIPLLVNDYKTSWNAGYFMLYSAFSGISIELGCDLTKCDFSFGDYYSCGLPAVSFWHHLWGHTVFSCATVVS